MFDARLHTDKLPPNIVDGLKNFSESDCYLIKRDVDRKSILCASNNCHINVQKRVDKYGGEMVNGWLLARRSMLLEMGVWVWFYHSVWVTPKQKIVDVTDNEDYKNLPLSTFIPDKNRLVNIPNGIAFNTIVIFDNQRVANQFEVASGEDRRLIEGVVYWTTNSVKHFREMHEHTGKYKLIRREYPQNKIEFEEKYKCKIEGNRIVPLDIENNMIKSDLFFDFSIGGG